MLLSKYCDVPVYSLWDIRLGKGIIGGKLISGYDQGKTAAIMARRILRGEKVENIPIVYRSPIPYKFDYEQMSRFDIEILDLPAGSLVINQPYSFYSENKASCPDSRDQYHRSCCNNRYSLIKYALS